MRRCSLKPELKKTLRSTKDLKMRNFGCLFFILTLPAESFTEEKKAEEVIGILGESVTFHQTTSDQSAFILWLKVTNNGADNIAIVQKGQPCQVEAALPKYEGRLNVSRDCSSLQITKLHEDDSGDYKAQIKDNRKHFRLKVYKKLSESNLKVQCKINSPGNYTELNCSAGNWRNGVNYTWTSTSKDEKTSSHVIQIEIRDGDANYTCTAENPVSNASKTVSIKEVCEANPTTGPGTVPTKGTVDSPKDSLNPVWIALAIIPVAAACIGFVLWKRHKKAAHRMPPDPTDCTVPDETCKTIYAQIDCRPSETQQTGMKKPQPQKRPAQEEVHTIYCSVQPKPTDDSAIKTVYDTVNAPRPPEGSEFRKLL